MIYGKQLGGQYSGGQNKDRLMDITAAMSATANSNSSVSCHTHDKERREGSIYLTLQGQQHTGHIKPLYCLGVPTHASQSAQAAPRPAQPKTTIMALQEQRLPQWQSFKEQWLFATLGFLVDCCPTWNWNTNFKAMDFTLFSKSMRPKGLTWAESSQQQSSANQGAIINNYFGIILVK